MHFPLFSEQSSLKWLAPLLEVVVTTGPAFVKMQIAGSDFNSLKPTLRGRDPDKTWKREGVN